jgi:hypothetical protein
MGKTKSGKRERNLDPRIDGIIERLDQLLAGKSDSNPPANDEVSVDTKPPEQPPAENPPATESPKDEITPASQRTHWLYRPLRGNNSWTADKGSVR